MRAHCHCGAIASYWYAPMIYKKMEYEEWLSSHAYCEEHADVDNWAEYHYVGFHKRKWQWLKRNTDMDKRNAKVEIMLSWDKP